jgi:hypothetical protein
MFGATGDIMPRLAIGVNSRILKEREFLSGLLNIFTCHGFRANKETCKMALLTGYFDESGVHKGDHLCVVAGFIGNENQWGSYINDWITALGPQRKNLHMQSLRWKQHPQRIAALLEKLGPIPHRYNLTPVYSAMYQRDYREIMEGNVAPEYTTPFMTCAQTCMAITLQEVIGDSEVAFIFERRRVDNGAIESLNSFVFGAVGVDSRVRELTFSTYKHTVCLDAADFLAYQIRELNLDKESPKAKMGMSIMQGEAHGGTFTREQMIEKTADLIRLGVTPGSKPIRKIPDDLVRELIKNKYWRGPKV